jgi:hypothetical protein
VVGICNVLVFWAFCLLPTSLIASVSVLSFTFWTLDICSRDKLKSVCIMMSFRLGTIIQTYHWVIGCWPGGQ